MQSTIQLFRHLVQNIPPLFPVETKKKMEHALSHLESDQTISLEEVENTMIAFGYEVWPWNEAYKEYLAIAETRVGEHFLLPRLSQGMQEKYREFMRLGGTLRDLHSGSAAHNFEPEERTELCEALVEMQRDLRRYVNQEVAGLEQTRYLKRVREFMHVLGEIKQTMGRLRDLADREQDHPSLAQEIRAKVKSFEHGLCLLGPELSYDAVCESVDFFHGRKQELNRLRGIHVPLEIDFYRVN